MKESIICAPTSSSARKKNNASNHCKIFPVGDGLPNNRSWMSTLEFLSEGGALISIFFARWSAVIARVSRSHTFLVRGCGLPCRNSKEWRVSLKSVSSLHSSTELMGTDWRLLRSGGRAGRWSHSLPPRCCFWLTWRFVVIAAVVGRSEFDITDFDITESDITNLI